MPCVCGISEAPFSLLDDLARMASEAVLEQMFVLSELLPSHAILIFSLLVPILSCMSCVAHDDVLFIVLEWVIMGGWELGGGVGGMMTFVVDCHER